MCLLIRELTVFRLLRRYKAKNSLKYLKRKSLIKNFIDRWSLKNHREKSNLKYSTTQWETRQIQFILKVQSQVRDNFWKPFKTDEKCFLFHVKSYFRSRDIYIFVLTFWSCKLRLILCLLQYSYFPISQEVKVIRQINLVC